MDKNEELKINERKDKIKKIFSQNDKIILFALMAFVIIFRLYYFFKLGNQPIWWDEGDYLALSKVLALDAIRPEWWSHFSGMRPFFLPLVWTIFFKIGFGELTIRFFTELLPSLGAIYVCYLLGKEMYNKYVGIIAATMMSGYWVFFFYSFRLLTDIPAVFFGLLTIYFFWKYYKTDSLKDLILSSLFGVIAFSIRFPYALIPIISALFLLITRKLSVIKDKKIWKGLIATFIFLSPYLIYLISTDFAPLRFYSSGASQDPIAWYTLSLFTSLFFSWWFIAFIIGILTLYPLFLYGDVIWKQKIKDYNKELYLFLMIVINILFYVFGIRGSTDRWLLVVMPASFILAGAGLMLVYEKIKKYSINAAIIVVVLVLMLGFYQNMDHAVKLTESKKESYLEEKLAGEWLKQNTDKDSKIITASVVQIYYYSERQTYDFNEKTDILSKNGCFDRAGNLNTNISCQTDSEKYFDEFVNLTKPDYYIIHVFEPVLTPAWAYTYPQRNNLTAIQAYMNKDNPNQPMLIIYEYPKN